MRIPLVFSVVLAIAAAGPLTAHEPETLPTAEPQPLQPVPATVELSSDEVQHLLKAAQHLDSAGLKEDAHRLRSLARDRTVRENVVARKEAELECLLSEIEELRQLTGEPRIVLVRVAAIEFSRAALGESATGLDAILGRHVAPAVNDGPKAQQVIHATGIAGNSFNNASLPEPVRATLQASASFPASRIAYSVVEGHPLAHPLFRELRENGRITILAEPVLATTSGRPSSLLSGGQFPLKVQTPGGGTEVRMISFGTQLEACPTVLAGDRVRIQARLEISQKDFADAISAGGERVPGLSTRSVNTEVEMRLGQTAVVGGMAARPRRGSADPDGTAAGSKRGGVDAVPSPAHDLREMIVFISVEKMYGPSVASSVQLIPAEIEPDELRRVLSPAGVPDDLQYFPASPIPRKGTLR